MSHTLRPLATGFTARGPNVLYHSTAYHPRSRVPPALSAPPTRAFLHTPITPKMPSQSTFVHTPFTRTPSPSLAQPDGRRGYGGGGDGATRGSAEMSRLPSPLFAPIPLAYVRSPFKRLFPRRRLHSAARPTRPPSPTSASGSAGVSYMDLASESSDAESVAATASREGRKISRELMTRPSGEGRYVRIVEVSPRDGLQNLKGGAVPTVVKKELVERLLEAGVRNVEVGSFVRGDWVPQMADTPRLLPLLPPFTGRALRPPTPASRSESPFSGRPSSPSITPLTGSRLPPDAEDVHYPVLVPNMRGLENLIKLQDEWKEKGIPALTDEIAVFVSATEAFSKANNHAPISKVLDALPAVIARAKSRNLRVRGYVSCVITCPYSGPTQPEKAIYVADQLLKMGCYEVSLGDTTGEGDPGSWRVLWEKMRERGVNMDLVAAHCHDTFSLALSSILSLVPLGLRTIDSSLAGLGGCPYSPGATGNVPTEDVVYALHKMGYETGIDLDRLVESGNWLTETLGVRNESRVGRAIWARRVHREKKEEADRETEDGM